MPKRKRASSIHKPQQEDNKLLPQVRFSHIVGRRVPTPLTLLFKKRHYRQRAHANPFSDHALDYPASPALMGWDVHFPAFTGSGKTPEFADIGCGFGGLLIALAPLFPDKLMLGTSYVLLLN